MPVVPNDARVWTGLGSDNSIISSSSTSRFGHAIHRQDGESHRVANESRIARGFYQHPISPLDFPHDTPTNYDRRKRRWGPRHLPVHGQEHHYPRCAVLLGLHKPGITFGGAYLPFREAPLPACKGQASTVTCSRPESGLESQARRARKLDDLSFHFGFALEGVFCSFQVDPQTWQL